MPVATSAPPLERAFARPPEAPDRTAVRRRVARRVGWWTGSLWTGALMGLLLGLGRVPWPEATIWSVFSGALVGRSVQTGLQRLLEHLLEPCTLELGPSDPQAFAARARRRAARYGYRVESRLHADTFRPGRWVALLPPLRVAWSGPGAVVEGPRFLVRSLARLAVG